jgi:electron transfer flavoprotein alpha subunit
MTTILVHVETTDGEISGSSFELLAAARELAGGDGRVEALLVTADPQPFLSQLGAADGVVAVTHESYGQYISDSHAAALVAAIEARQPDLTLLAYSTQGLDLAPAAAQKAGRPLVSYCTGAEIADGQLKATSQLYGGKLEAEVEAALPAVVAMNPGAYPEEPGRAEGTPPVEEVAPPASAASPRMTVVEEIAPETSDVDITQVDRLLCVGRGIGDQDSISEAEEVAKLLGAEIAGSRPIIDNGWLPKARQVGKSGHKVKPKLYLAMGVSGAPEHLEGMRDAGLIIAVNSDAQAPIFGVAHYGAACDLFDVLEALSEDLSA